MKRLIDVSGLLKDAGVKQEFTILINNASRRNQDGLLDNTGFQPFLKYGSIQPATGKQVMLLPENMRLQDVIVVYVDNIDDIEPLRIGNAETPSDLILYNDLYYAVRKAMNYGVHGHTEIIAVRINYQNDKPSSEPLPPNTGYYDDFGRWIDA